MKYRIKGLPWLLTIAGAAILASLAVDQKPVSSLIGSPALRMIIKLVALAFSAGSGVFSYARSEKRQYESSAKQAQKDATARLEATLVSSIQNLFVGEMASTIRANIMIVSGDELHMLSSANMLVFPDFSVRLRRGQGCAGLAWEHALTAPMDVCWKPVYATMAQLTSSRLRDKWQLTDEQIRQTGHILWILSVPLFRKAGHQRTFIGVLNFDGVHRSLQHPSRLSQPDFIGQCVAVGERIAEEAAALLSRGAAG